MPISILWLSSWIRPLTRALRMHHRDADIFQTLGKRPFREPSEDAQAVDSKVEGRFLMLQKPPLFPHSAHQFFPFFFFLS